MAAGTHPEAESRTEPEAYDGPEISICECGPGRTVFIESGNTDGWIASDLTVDVTR
jgi:hypothetical protein